MCKILVYRDSMCGMQAREQSGTALRAKLSTATNRISNSRRFQPTWRTGFPGQLSILKARSSDDRRVLEAPERPGPTVRVFTEQFLPGRELLGYLKGSLLWTPRNAPPTQTLDTFQFPCCAENGPAIAIESPDCDGHFRNATKRISKCVTEH